MTNLSILPIHVYLVTFGSMLAELEVQRALLGSHLQPPFLVPAAVEWWRNVMNRGDLLAFRSEGLFSTNRPQSAPKDIPINTQQMRERNVASYYVSRHDAGAYLRDPSTAKAIRQAWCAVTPESADCKKLRGGH
jgi:hypothetical protein